MAHSQLASLAVLMLATVAASGSLVARQTVQGTAGCGKPHDSGYKTNDGAGFTITSSGGTRRYNFRVPNNYDPDRPYALIFDYHGHNSNRDTQYHLTRYDQYATGRNDFLVVYPQGLKDDEDEPAWEGAPYARPDVSDLQFTADLLAKFRANYCVDDARVYASGKSNGGGFVATLACSPQGAPFAAFAMAAAALYTDNLAPGSPTYRACVPPRARVPVLEAHGTADTTIPYAGNATKGVPSVLAWLGTWAGRDGCSGSQVTHEYSSYGTVVWSCPGYPGIVSGYRLDGYGHCWPGNNPEQSKANCGNPPVDFTPVVLTFFNSWDINGYIGVSV